MSAFFPHKTQRAALARIILVAGSSGLSFAFAGAAHAGPEIAALECSGFCRPIDPHQLDTSRAQGETASRANASTQLSVILWDENRRLAPPSGTTGTVTSPTNVPVTITPPNLPAPVPVLVH